MTKFILRRLSISLLVLFGGSILLFVLLVNSGDPLADLRESNAENREYLIRQRTEFMGLNLPWYLRYFNWLRGVGGCVRLQCDLGVDRTGVNVTSLLGNAAQSTLRLVVLATLLAIVIGVTVGILTAIRQYSGFDYAATFLAFLFFSLPVFWVAVLLKEFGAIRFNDWIVEPTFGLTTILIVAAVLAFIVQGILGGTRRRRVVTAGTVLVFVVAAMSYFSAVQWFRRPALGVGLLVVVGIAGAVGFTVLVTGLANKAVLYAGLTTAAAGVVAYFVFAGAMAQASWGLLAGLFLLTLAVSFASGWFWGGYSRRAAIGVSIAVGVSMALVTVLDYAVSHWASLLGIKPRPISTIGSQTPNFPGGFWESFLDKGAQLILPTIVLTLISVASYTRYTRASMLEVLDQDYVRTARSKGLSERVVITKHAFRNALIPITTIVAFDFAGLIGGAVITEKVFGWKGMGELFVRGLDLTDPAPVMAFFLVTGTAAILMNLAADLAYAGLDPRIRR